MIFEYLESNTYFMCLLKNKVFPGKVLFMVIVYGRLRKG